MKLEGVTWHGIVLGAPEFAAYRALLTDTMGLQPMLEMEGWSLFPMPNGSIVDLFSPELAADWFPWGLNDGLVFGFRVDDIEKASLELAEAGCDLLGEVNHIEDMKYHWRHYRGPDGRVYGLNQQD